MFSCMGWIQSHQKTEQDARIKQLQGDMTRLRDSHSGLETKIGQLYEELAQHSTNQGVCSALSIFKGFGPFFERSPFFFEGVRWCVNVQLLEAQLLQSKAREEALMDQLANAHQATPPCDKSWGKNTKKKKKKKTGDESHKMQHHSAFVRRNSVESTDFSPVLWSADSEASPVVESGQSSARRGFRVPPLDIPTQFGDSASTMTAGSGMEISLPEVKLFSSLPKSL